MQINRWQQIVTVLALLGLSGCDYMPSVPTFGLFGDDEGEDDKNRLAGERITVLPQDTQISADASAQNKAFNLPQAQANPSWEQHTGDFAADRSNLVLLGDLTRQQSASAGDDTEFSHHLIPAPVVANGVVFAMDAEGAISAHQAQDIDATIWRSAGLVQEDEEDILGGGLAYYDGRLYATSGRGLVAAFNAENGEKLWQRALLTPLRSAPKLMDNRLYVITMDNQLFVMDAIGGDVLWTHFGIPESAAIMNTVAPAINKDVAIIPYSSGQIYALSPVDGTEYWSDSLARGKRTEALSLLSGIGGDPIIDGDAVISVSSGGMLSVHALTNGQRAWQKSIGSLNTPWVAGEWMYVLSTSNSLICLHKYDGAVRWSTQLAAYEDESSKKDPIVWRGPVMANGRLLLVSSIGEMVEISADTGELVATHEIPEDIYTAPVVAGGIVYLQDQDATLYAIQ